MKITIENTSKIVMLAAENGEQLAAIPARVWEGKTETGIPVHCFVTRIAVAEGCDTEQFAKELFEQRAPSAEVRAIPPWLVL